MGDGGYHINDQGAIHFVTLTVVDWVDVFSRQIYRELVIDSLRFCQKNKGLELYGFVIMSNHIHMVVQSNSNDLSGFLRDFKSYVAKQIIDKILEGPESRAEWMLTRFGFAARSNKRNSQYQFWKSGNHPEEIYTEKFLWQKLNYIHMNPVRAGIVKRASEYVYSSASNYVNGNGILEIELPSNPIVDATKFSGYHLDIEEW